MECRAGPGCSAAYLIPDTATSTGTEEPAVVPFPNWPSALLPQHLTVPPDNNAHEWYQPADTAVPVVIPDTATGTDESVVVPFPN